MAGRFYESPADLYLKPMHLVDTASIHSRTPSYTSNNYYDPVPPIPNYSSGSNFEHTENDHLQNLETYDSSLKRRIRVLKIISRISATILSAVTLGLLVATIVKFFLTKDVYFDVNGVKRTAWAHDTITWYTYMYAGIAAVSFILNSVILLSYCRSIRAANKAATVSSWWTWIIFSAHIILWAVSAGIYRYGKEPVDGKFRDLWGWTCSESAQELQSVLTSVDFEKYCSIQSSSWYSGLANAALGILGGVITGLAVVRMRSKKRLGRVRSGMEGSDMEPLRERV